MACKEANVGINFIVCFRKRNETLLSTTKKKPKVIKLCCVDRMQLSVKEEKDVYKKPCGCICTFYLIFYKFCGLHC